MARKTYSDIKPGDTVQGAAGNVRVDRIEDQDGVRVFHGTRPGTGEPASTWGCADADVWEQ